MNIALDYDGTYTSDPTLWLRFVLDAQAAGHTVTVVTMRFPSECANGQVDHRLAALGVDTIATARMAKRPHCEKLGHQFHIWIDDHPEAVLNDAAAIWPDPAPEGQPVVPDYS